MLRRLFLLLQRHPLLSEVIIAPLLMGALFLLAFGKYLSGDYSIATFQDNTHFLLPLFNHISKIFSSGEYPYWINTIAGGIQFYNNPQFSITYPFYFFHFDLYSSPVAALRHMHDVTFFHIFIGYLNSYVLLRVLRLPPLSALLGASLFTFSPNTYSYSVWINIVAPYMWFPLVIAAVILLLENRFVKVGILLGAISFSLLILASPAQPLIHIAYTIVILYLFNALRCWKNKEKSTFLAGTKNMIVMGVLTLIIASPMIAPVLANSRQMIRFIGQLPPVIGNAKIPFEGFTVGQLKVSHLATSLLPLEHDIVIGDAFVGMSAALLSLFAIFKVRQNWVILPLLFISIYALLSATGTHLGLAQLNYHIPLINKIREPGRHLFLFTFGVSVLAAFGFNYLTEVLGQGLKPVLRLKHLAVVVIFLILVIFSLNVDLPYKGTVSRPLLLVIFGVTFGVLLMMPFLRGWGAKVVPVLAVLLIVYANLQYPWYLPKLERGDYFTTENLTSHNVLGEMAKIEDARSYRFLFADQQWNTQYWPMNASYYGLRSFEAFLNPLPNARQFSETFVQHLHLRRYYPLLGGKYYLCNPCDSALLADYRFEKEINGYSLYIADNALPRYTVVNRVVGQYEHRVDFFNQLKEGFDYTREVYLDKENMAKVGNWLGEQPAPPQYVLKEESSSHNGLRVSLNTEGRAIFLFNEFYNKDWKAKVNGIPVRPVRVNLNQIGVPLEKGANLIEMEYHPTLFIWMLWLQRAGLLFLIVFTLYGAISSQFPLFRK